MASGARAGLDAAVNGSTLPALELGVNLTAPPLQDWGDATLAVNFSQPSFEWQGNFSSMGTDAFEGTLRAVDAAQFNWKPYFVPSFSQIFLSIVQLLLVHFGLRKSSIINAMNCQIASLEKRMNDELNAVITRSVGGVLDETVKHETARAEEVFSQAEVKIDQLEATVQTLTDVESYTAEIEKVKAAVQGEAKEMVSGVDTVLKSGVEQVAKQKEEMQARIQRAYAAAVAAEAALKGDPKAAAKAAAGAASSAASRLRKSFF